MKSAMPEDEYMQEITQRKDQKCCAALKFPNLLNIYLKRNLSKYLYTSIVNTKTCILSLVKIY